MTFSAIQIETRTSSIRFDETSNADALLVSNIEFLNRHIVQLATEKDMLQRNATSCIEMLEVHIQKLASERDLLTRRRHLLANLSRSSEKAFSQFSCIPMVSVTQFLTAPDVCRLKASSGKLSEMCNIDGKDLIVHMCSPSIPMDRSQALSLVNRLCLPLIETLQIDAKKAGGKALLSALCLRADSLTSLRSVRISAAAETGDFLMDLRLLMSRIPANQIRSIHLSGLRSVGLVAELIERQTESIESFKVDYFVNGHESDISMIPRMPKLRNFVFDVADVVHLPVSVISNVLLSIENKTAVESIYMPHMQISGQSHEIVTFIEELKDFNNIRQLVVRFRKLPLSVRDIVALREAFDSLPAVCISDHFIVMLDCWATWWPKQSAIWTSPDKITGLSVFREQIDFESLGTTANREWLRLTRDQKNLWSRRIAGNVMKLYLNTA
jgi:hypothetical protein